jgi:hypothetical protein
MITWKTEDFLDVELVIMTTGGCTEVDATKVFERMPLYSVTDTWVPLVVSLTCRSH